MKRILSNLFLLFLILIAVSGNSQNQTNRWYFGTNAGLNFMTSPPSVLTNGVLSTIEGCATISSATGNLLFYTDGITVYNQNHVAMANGTGLTGNSSSSQSAIIAKQPGNTNIYYIFTQSGPPGAGAAYSIVDMNLAAGIGSVTTKNVSLSSICTEKLTSVRHCNGSDIWVIIHDWNSANFKSFLLTSTGVNTTPVVSSIGTNHTGTANFAGCMKTSPNGKKLGLALHSMGAFEMYDFDNTTGVVSNSLVLYASAGTAYGCEFSPDGSKFYGSTGYANGFLFQWDLCAGSNTAIVASRYAVYTSTAGIAAMQTASDGKIYVARYNQNTLGIINSPNTLGVGCNYVDLGISIAPRSTVWSIPNFITSLFRPTPPPYTYSVNCQTASFSAPPAPSMTLMGCSAVGYSLVSMLWDFGDPGSGLANSSSATNPVHSYGSLGTYTVTLILNYSCGGGTDTLRQAVLINQPCIAVSSTSITCANLGSATVAATGGIGPFSYTWMPTNQTSSVATGLSPGLYTIRVYDFGINFSYTAQTIFTSLIPLTGNVSVSDSVMCNGAATGTGAITGLAGGSGSQTYSWFNGTNTYTTASTNSLSAGIWSVNVTDALTGCQINQALYVAQPAPLVLSLSASTPSSCVGGDIVLTGTNSGGIPGYTYTWSAGPAIDTHTVSQLSGGTYIYTLNSSDANNCFSTNTISLGFVNAPALSVSHASICPLTTGTLTAFGASSYTWNGSFVGNSFSDNPLSNTQYSVLGSALGCSAAATASIILHPLPLAFIMSNAPVCNGQALQLSGAGGVSYNWTGPLAYSSALTAPVINPANPAQSGVYNVTVTSVNACTASTSASLTVNPTPTLSALGSTVCNTGTLTLSANSVPGALYAWSGPQGFTSALQNPTYNYPQVNRSGLYTVKVTSPFSCTNSAVADVTVTQLPIPLAANDGPKCMGTTISFFGSGADGYNWSGPAGFNSPLQNPQIAFVNMSAMGTYTLTVSRGPCVNTTTTSLTVHPLPTPIANNNGPACETKTLQLLATTGSSVTNYYWYGPMYFSLLKDPQRDSVKLSYSGVYTLTVQDKNGCLASTQTTVAVLPNPTVTASGATVCLNEAAMLSANGAVSYLWSGPVFYQSNLANAIIPSVTIDRNGTYTVVGTAANTCTGTATAKVLTRSLPVPTLTVKPKTRICLNEDFTLSGAGGERYEWYGPDNIYYQGQTIKVVADHFTAAGTYTLKVSDDKGCAASVYTLISIDNLPSGSLLGSKMQGCVPLCSDFVFIPSTGTPAKVSSSWMMNGKMLSGTKFSHCFSQPGDNLIRGTLYDSTTTCTNTLDVYVSVYEKPAADFEFAPLKPIENVDEVIFTNSSRGEEQITWNWYFSNNKGYKTSSENPVYLFQEEGTYPVVLVVRNKWGCEDSTLKVINVLEDFTMYVPNVFTPNEDNKNEVFLPVGRGVKSYHMMIYNRWGTKIFESSDITKGWDGTYNGQACKPDVYTWKMVVSSIHGEQKSLTGEVMILK